ncbi:MAG: hypothetical protein GXO79_13490 [Chlorobi bacterium]|nr:hypothetical protein [Chlorobiota bacterium]
MKRKIFLILLSGFFLSFNLFSQIRLNDVDFHQIRQKKIKKLLQKQKQNNIERFTDLKPSYKEGDNKEHYLTMEQSFLIKEKIDKVWKEYKALNPVKTWSGKMVSFGLEYSQLKNKLFYASEVYKGIELGQVFYLNLKLLRGVYNLAMAFEIVTIDDVNKIIEFSYVNCNKAKGKQELQFVETPEGYTKIIHSTYFKSKSKIRDAALYPFFHQRAIKEFHRNICFSSFEETPVKPAS